MCVSYLASARRFILYANLPSSREIFNETVKRINDMQMKCM